MSTTVPTDFIPALFKAQLSSAVIDFTLRLLPGFQVSEVLVSFLKQFHTKKDADILCVFRTFLRQDSDLGGSEVSVEGRFGSNLRRRHVMCHTYCRDQRQKHDARARHRLIVPCEPEALAPFRISLIPTSGASSPTATAAANVVSAEPSGKLWPCLPVKL